LPRSLNCQYRVPVIVHELSPAECRGVLKRSHLGRLACARGGQPYVVPISFDFDGEHVYSFSILGQKIVWMRDNPLVCLEVDEIADRFNWTSVVAFGRYQELRTSAEHAEARDRARELFELREEWWQPAAAKTQPPEKHVPIVYRIAIDRISGRRASRNETRST
jgi:nitroimidazol reductase NimA-like FMN-containing flavoprotein (pyridoxamine 5'-phosphate oxidase superfamily)